MLKEKRVRLERRGWKVGTVQELLGLRDEEAANVECRLHRAHCLRKRRQRKSLSQAGLAVRSTRPANVPRSPTAQRGARSLFEELLAGLAAMRKHREGRLRLRKHHVGATPGARPAKAGQTRKRTRPRII